MLTVHRARQLLVAERTALVNQTRGLLAEYGLIVSTGVGALRRALPELLESPALPGLARDVFADLADRLRALDERITTYDRRVTQLARQTEPAQRLMQPPAWGRSPPQRWWPPSGMPMPSRTAVSLRRGWAWSPGNIPVEAPDGWAESPSAGMSISARIHGARAVMRHLARRTDATSRWVLALKARRGFNKAVVALAAKQARVLWALLATGRRYVACP